MPQAFQHGAIARFGDFDVDFSEASVRRNGTPISIQEKPLQLLLILLESHGQLITRETLCSRLWPDDDFGAFDDGLNTAVRKLRIALCDSADGPTFIETVPKRGYRFIASVDFVPAMEMPTVDLPLNQKPSIFAYPWSKPVLVTLGAILLIAAGAVSALIIVAGHRNAQRHGEFSAVVVLPLEQLSGDSSQEYFADGMTDALITDLAKITSLRVISRSTAMHFKGTNLTARQIANQLGVDALVEGSITRSGDHVRITAQLIDVREDRHVWAESYSGEMSNILTLQDTVAMSIAREVSAKLAPGTNGRTTRNVQIDAYDAYLKGWYFWNKYTPEDFRRALVYFQKSIDADPQFAPAYVGLSDTYSMFSAYAVMPANESMPKAKAAAERALALDDTSGEAHIALANAQFTYDWDWEGAEQEFQRGIKLNPNYALGYHWHANLLQVLGHQAEGIAEQKRAAALDPLSLIVNTNLCRAYLFAKQLNEAIDQCRKSLELDPAFWFASRWLSQALYQKGAFREYAEEKERILRATGDPKKADLIEGIFASSGIDGLRRWEARQRLETAAHAYVPPPVLATDYIVLGDRENALRYLEKGYQDRSFGLLLIGLTDSYAPLRSEPRYLNIRRKMKLPE
jgi:TolB-like protein/DNA-binding winged helix-turn-helix (wHTH) protein/tetratricopeptide (TPR) repeat protein